MKSNTSLVFFISAIAAIGGLLIGYDTAVISGAIGDLTTYFDLDVTGSSNVFTTVIEVDDARYDVDVTGSSNDVNTSMTDGADHKIDLELIQSSGNIDIVQSSGTCPTGISSCHSELIADFDSENATITINQKDTGD